MSITNIQTCIYPFTKWKIAQKHPTLPSNAIDHEENKVPLKQEKEFVCYVWTYGKKLR